MKIAAIVVTYNRLPLLKECINSLRSQTRKPDVIIVVNNGSTDGSTEWLDQQSNIEVFHQENLGSSGGFSRGIDEAYKKSYDWIWVMDDDAEPLLNCLENMEAAFTNCDADVFAPLLIKASNKEVDVMHRGLMTENRWTLKHDQHILYPEKIETPFYQPVDFVSFVGPMFSKKVVENVGLPNKDLFLHFDDFEYSLRIKDAGFKTILVYNASILHKENAHDRKTIDVLTFKMGEPIEKGKLFTKYFSPRNQIYLTRQRCGFLAALFIAAIHVSREVIRHLLLKPSVLSSRVGFYYNAVRDGLTMNLDNTKPKKLISTFKQ